MLFVFRISPMGLLPARLGAVLRQAISYVSFRALADAPLHQGAASRSTMSPLFGKRFLDEAVGSHGHRDSSIAFSETRASCLRLRVGLGRSVVRWGLVRPARLTVHVGHRADVRARNRLRPQTIGADMPEWREPVGCSPTLRVRRCTGH